MVVLLGFLSLGGVSVFFVGGGGMIVEGGGGGIVLGLVGLLSLLRSFFVFLNMMLVLVLGRSFCMVRVIVVCW